MQRLINSDRCDCACTVADGCIVSPCAMHVAFCRKERDRGPDEMRMLAVHLNHCNFGEHVEACKYGSTQCPALTESWSWFGRMIQKAKPNHPNHLRGELHKILHFAVDGATKREPTSVDSCLTITKIVSNLLLALTDTRHKGGE